MEAVRSNPKVAEAIKVNGDVYEVSGGPIPIQIQQKGDWAVITGPGEKAANAPADPLKLLGDLPKNYDLAVRVSVKDIPEPLRQMALSRLGMGATMGMPPMPGNNGQANLSEAVQAITELVNDLDTVTLGFKIDPATNKTYFDLEMTAKPGTKLADKCAQIKPGKSAFGGVQFPGAAVTLNQTGAISADDVAKAQAKLATFHQTFLAEVGQQGLSDDQVKLVTRLSNDVLDVLKKTLATKTIDCGFALMLEPTAVTLVGGGAVVEGAKLENVLKQLADELQKTDPEASKAIKFNAETHEGVRFHTLSIPTPDPKFVPMLGASLDVVVGTAADKVTMAAGRDAAKMLKKFLDQSKAAAGNEVPPWEVKLAIGKIAKFMVGFAKNEGPPNASGRAAMLLKALKQAGDKDHIIVTGSPIAQGTRMRVEIEEGLIKGLASIGPMMMPMGGPGPGMGPGGPGMGGPGGQPMPPAPTK
jgi:hypothetical protein